MTNAEQAPFYSTLLLLRNQLALKRHRLVLAESCTAGMAASTLGKIPGISNHLCGSMVVYRTQTKTDWLGISPTILQDPQIGPVSDQTTDALVHALLEKTPEASIAAAITGHLGPGAPAELDGTIFCAIAERDPDGSPMVFSSQHRLQSPAPTDNEDLAGRELRQWEATQVLLNAILEFIDE